MFKRTAMIIGLAYSSPILAEAPDGVAAKWLCRADQRIECTNGVCKSKGANVTMEIDFSEMTVQNFSLDEPTRLVGVNKSRYSNTVYFASNEGQSYIIEGEKSAGIGGVFTHKWQMLTHFGARDASIYYGECRER